MVIYSYFEDFAFFVNNKLILNVSEIRNPNSERGDRYLVPSEKKLMPENNIFPFRTFFSPYLL